MGIIKGAKIEVIEAPKLAEVKPLERPIFEFRAEKFPTYAEKDLTGDLAESGIRLREMTITPDLLQKSVGARVMNLSLTETKTRTIVSPKLAIAAVALTGVLGVVIRNPELVSWMVEHIKAFASLFGMVTLPFVGMVMGGGKKETVFPPVTLEYISTEGKRAQFDFPTDRLSGLRFSNKAPKSSEEKKHRISDPLLGNADVGLVQGLEGQFHVYNSQGDVKIIRDVEGNLTQIPVAELSQDVSTITPYTPFQILNPKTDILVINGMRFYFKETPLQIITGQSGIIVGESDTMTPKDDEMPDVTLESVLEELNTKAMLAENMVSLLEKRGAPEDLLVGWREEAKEAWEAAERWKEQLKERK